MVFYTSNSGSACLRSITVNQSSNITKDHPVLLENLLLSIESLPKSSLHALAKSHGIQVVTETKEPLLVDGLRNMLSEHIFKGSCSSSIDNGCMEVLKSLRTRTETDCELNCGPEYQ